MSIARPTAIIRRAAALPMVLLDRLDARLSAGFTRVDSRATRAIHSTTGFAARLGQGVASHVGATDQKLNQGLAKSDAKNQLRITKLQTRVRNVGIEIRSFEAGIDSRLVKNLQNVDRVAATVSNGARASILASMRLADRVDNRLVRGFDRADTRMNNFVNQVHYQQVKTQHLAHRSATNLDLRIQTGFNRTDLFIAAGVNHSHAMTQNVAARFSAALDTTDSRLAGAVDRVDTRIFSSRTRISLAAIATKDLIDAKALAFEHAVELGITRVDSQIDRQVKQAVAIKCSALVGVNSLDTRIAKAAEVSDARINVATVAMVSAARNVAYLTSNRMETTDQKLTQTLSRIDSRVDAFVLETNGKPAHAGRRASAAPPWVATSLTLVLGTLGAAAGATAVNASMSTNIDVDKTVKIEAGAAKEAVTQYLSVRDSFKALQASRNRTIENLQQDISEAQSRASKSSLDGKAVMSIANDYNGVPYVWGGTTPKGFDCSGYTKYVFGKLGVTLPRTAGAQFSWSKRVQKDDRKVGDLMFWHGKGGVYHVAIYAGDGKMWDSPRPGRSVSKKEIWGNPTYGRPPAKAINGSALAEIAEKTAELEEVQNDVPTLEIEITDRNTLPSDS
jgi:cell wall-associated NlpC family hydrolase